MKTVPEVFRFRNLQFLLHLTKIKGLPFAYSLLLSEDVDRLEKEIDNFVAEEKTRRVVEKLKKEEEDSVKRIERSRNQGVSSVPFVPDQHYPSPPTMQPNQYRRINSTHNQNQSSTHETFPVNPYDPSRLPRNASNQRRN